jgi:hypothetical protein
LSVAEQIAAFRGARLVIGAHGVGMSNIVFCQSGSFVYEMLPRHYPNAAFNRLAQAAGLNYWADLFEGVGEGSPYQRGWRIDLEIAAARLEAIRQRIAATPRLESAMVFLRRTQAAHPDDETAVPIPPPQPEPKPERKSEEVASELPARGLLARFRRGVPRRPSRDEGG